MRELLRPRLWIALLCGIAALLVVWLLPPQPGRSLGRLGGEYMHLQVCALSTDARFVVTRRWHSKAKFTNGETISVIDRDNESPVLELQLLEQNWLFLSPNEQMLCVVAGVPEKTAEMPDGMLGIVATPRPITLYDLASGQKLKEYKSAGHHPFFGHDNKLLAIENGVLRDIESGAEVRRLPAQIDGFKYRHSMNEFAFFVKEDPGGAHLQLYSWLTGEVRSSATFPRVEFVTQVSKEGRVLCWVEPSWNNVGLREKWPSRILDTATGELREYPRTGLMGTPQFSRASPDGEYFVHLIKMPPLPKWLQWLPNKRSTYGMRFVQWRADAEVVTLPGVEAVCFSADGSKLAAVRDDLVIDIYDFPFRKPWALIAGAALIASCLPWSIAWTWSRWRRNRKGGAA